MRNLEKGQHIFIAFQNGKAVLDSQLRPRMYTSLENADRWTPTVNKGKIEYVEYTPTLTPPNEPLTLEQLREMDGQPVWVVMVDEKFSGLNGWYLVHHGSAYLARIDDWELDDDKYGVEWLAYRRPLEGEVDA